MLERLQLLIYLIGILPSGGLLSAALIERQKRAEANRLLRIRLRDWSRDPGYDYDFDDYGSRVRKVQKPRPPRPTLRPEDREIHPVDRRVSMIVGYLAGIAWPALIAVGVSTIIVFGVGYGFLRAATAIGTSFGRYVLDPTTRKFEAKIEQRTLAEKPAIERRSLGTLEKLS